MTSLPPSCGNSLSDAVLADAVSFETITDLSIRLSCLIRDGSQLLVIQLCVHFSLTYISAVYIKETKWTPGKHEMKPKATTHGWKEECKNANVQILCAIFQQEKQILQTAWHGILEILAIMSNLCRHLRVKSLCTVYADPNAKIAKKNLK